MRNKKFVVFMLVGTVVGAIFLSAENYRTWNMIGGGHFEAKLTGVGTTAITLENKEGRSIDMPLTNFKPSDQDYARDWQKAQSPDQGGATVATVERTDFAVRVYKDLVYSKGKRLVDFEPEPTDNPKYFAFYQSAQWCPPCRTFTPKLVDFYKKQKRRGNPVELIFISSDRSEDAMAEYMDEYDMPWPAFAYGENKDIVQRNGKGIPSLIVTDANGKKLLDSYDSAGKFIGPTNVMDELEKLLK